ncbi:ABC transporter ATP-binding protein [Catenulispora sp. NL8]|uniref:ABC transporter ATP-binding protein n=1 Tax=Catenulispora pinistramenti TaxID=2705254 RepID=A0ABS5L5Z7_9ACTN|nr:ATP-binding cassette domain-containing protein [Catenulispora pinistramenti]MBS2553746.1 ABC transporter ATP-binding protein [Catenulispora pinistramenti]
MAEPVLEVSGLRKVFGSQVAVDDVSFTVAAGGSLGVVGESGSGKTTTARIIVGLDHADAGTVRIDGRDRDHAGRKARGADAGRGPSVARSARSGRRAERLARARQVQMVFQDPFLSLDPRLPIGTALTEVLRLHHPDGDHPARVTELLDQVGLGTREATALPRGLSGGQRQRVAIAKALAVEPSVLVLDEAVAALDVSVQAQILNLLADLRAELGIAYVFITHDLGVVRCVTDEVVVMRRGAIVERGATDMVLADPSHSYTRLLLESVPGPGWDPQLITAARRALAEAEAELTPR